MADKTNSGGADEAKAVEPLLTFAEFLEAVPPGEARSVDDLFELERRIGYSDQIRILTPDIQLHCTNETCGGLRFFRFENGDRLLTSNFKRSYISYVCSNCQKTRKIFALQASHDAKPGKGGVAFKYGESPAYGPPTPTRLLRLFGKDREIFLKGRRCENQGLGIAAFAYYRRVVESHKNQLLEEIEKVAQRVGGSNEMIQALAAAKNEIQFSKAMATVKDAIPQSLLINGQNPLTLLHSALSIGLHDETDERCLELAHDIRVILAELTDRIGQALKDEAELNTAVSRLMQPKK